MTVDPRTEQDREWALLYCKIKEALQQYGEDDRQGGKDYYLLDENVYPYQHRIETDKLQFALPSLIKSLRGLLIGLPNWEIVVALGSSYGGIVIRDDEIIDALQRENLPEELRTIAYEGGRPLGSKFHDIMYGADLLTAASGR